VNNLFSVVFTSFFVTLVKYKNRRQEYSALLTQRASLLHDQWNNQRVEQKKEAKKARTYRRESIGAEIVQKDKEVNHE